MRSQKRPAEAGTTNQRTTNDRRGVILLVAIGVLVVFTLTVLMFVINSRQFRMSARAASSVERYDVGFDEHLERALMSILRGDRNPQSPVQHHSLQEDRYGNDDIRIPALGQQPTQRPYIVASDNVRTGNGIEAGLAEIVVQDEPPGGSLPFKLHTQAGYYNGRLFTPLSGPARMQTSRVVGYRFDTNTGLAYFLVTSFDGGALPRPASNALPLGDVFLMNGREFNGTGFSYNPFADPNGDPNDQTPDPYYPVPPYPNGMKIGYGRGRVDYRDPTYGVPMSLLPNSAAHWANTQYSPIGDLDGDGLPDDLYTDPAGNGGADESYDAVDENNMVLAGRMWIPAPPDPNNPPPNYPAATYWNRWFVVNPSYYRPALANFFWNHPLVGSLSQNFDPTSSNYGTAQQFRRKYLLRALDARELDPTQRVGFDGSNPYLTQRRLAQPDANTDGVPDILQDPLLMWDVDNDGDGLADSIWVDLGMPIQTAADGRKFKPLFAVMVLDMDGKLNLNANGGLSDALLATAGLPSGLGAPPGPQLSPAGGFYANRPATVGDSPNANSQVYMPVGSGYSPTAISLYQAFTPLGAGGAALALAQQRTINLMYGIVSTVAQQNAEGRLGELELATTNAYAFPGQTDATADMEDHLKRPDFPGAWQSAKVPVVANPDFDFPVDFAELGMVGVDHSGQPIRLGMGLRPTGPAFWIQQTQHNLQANVYGGRAAPSVLGGGLTMKDNPFSMADFEVLLRPHDLDSFSLPNRLQRLLGMHHAISGSTLSALPRFPGVNLDEAPGASTSSGELLPGILTAESYDAPVFQAIPTPEMRWMLDHLSRPWGGSGGPRYVPRGPQSNTMSDLLLAKLFSEFYWTENPTPSGPPFSFTPQVMPDLAMRSLIPAALRQGVRYNLNDPLGSGRDENTNFTVDEPGEEFSENVWLFPAGPYTAYNGIGLDHNNDGVRDVLDYQSRQLKARYLYVLMMMLKDRGYVFPVDQNANLAPFNDPTTNLSMPEERQEEERRYTAHRIAQWAINAVDFRDPDSIMTSFEFDYEPFLDQDNNGDPWDVDGFVETNLVTNQPSTDDTAPWRNMVWGCEKPLLLLTESFACHDTGLDDTDDDDGSSEYTAQNMPPGDPPDPTLDQVRVPKGTTMIELYNPWNEPVPYEFRPNHQMQGGNPTPIPPANAPDVLDLGRIAPASANGDRFPVWQLTVVEGPPNIDDSPENRDLGNLLPTYPDADPSADPVTRIVWFTTEDAYGSDPNLVDGRIYYSRLTTAGNDYPQPGGTPPYDDSWDNTVNFNSGDNGAEQMFHIERMRYAVVGSRVRTKINRSGDPNQANPLQNAHRIQLLDEGAGAPQTLAPFMSDTPSVIYPNFVQANGDMLVREPKGMVINAPRAFTVSEPDLTEMDYPAPTASDQGLSQDPDDNSVYYHDRYDPPRDEPLDGFAPTPEYINDHCTVYLQRLANPLLPYHRTINPYITVDFIPVGLSTYHGELDSSHALAQYNGDYYFGTRERVGRPLGGEWNLWAQVFSDPENPDPFDVAPPIEVHPDDGTMNVPMGERPRDFVHSLGFVNGLLNRDSDNERGWHFARPAGLNSGIYSVWSSAEFPVNGPNGVFIGVPRSGVYPWFNWNDRPYISHYELMQVPASAPSRLLWEYDTRRGVAPLDDNDQVDHYRDRVRDVNQPPSTGSPPYAHLLNFFESSNVRDGETFDSTEPSGREYAWNDPWDPNQSNDTSYARSNFHRIFDFIQVPSPYLETDEMLNPIAMQGNNLVSSTSPGGIPHDLHPPNNLVSKLRDPGRVNVNTMFDDGSSWRGVMNNDDQTRMTQHWYKVFISRQGYGVVNGDSRDLVPLLDRGSPSMFANPFRPPGDRVNLGVPSQWHRPVFTPPNILEAYNPPIHSPGDTVPYNLVDSTFLRPDFLNPAKPLFSAQSDIDDAIQQTVGSGEGRTLTPNNTSAAHMNADLNSAFRYEALRKIGSTLTTRSNVYAVWITVGYFEVNPIPDGNNPAQLPPREVTPDGYILGQELGSEDGTLVRHRMFCIFDRSLPVAFQRGEDYNIRKAILVKRIIE